MTLQVVAKVQSPPLLLLSAGWVFFFPLALWLIHRAQLGRLGGSRFGVGFFK